MKWSKLKKLSESFLVESLKGRVQYHRTSYGKRDSTTMSRAWVTFDGEEVLSFSEVEWLGIHHHLTSNILSHSPQIDNNDKLTFHEAYEQATKRLIETGIYSQQLFVSTLREYLNLSIEDAVASKDPLIRALAMVDRRLGKRKFANIEIGDQEPKPIQEFYKIRKTVG